MHDVLGRVARPGHILLAVLQRCAHGVHARHEVTVLAEQVEHRAAHAGHRAHADGHVGAVGQFDTDVRDVRAERAHRERHHVQPASAHAAAKQGARAGLQQLAHLGRGHPVVGRAGVFLAGAADVSAVFDPGDVARIAGGEVAAGTKLGVELLHRSCGHQLGAQTVVLGLRTVAPVHIGGVGEGGDLGHPGFQSAVLQIGRYVEVLPFLQGTVHGISNQDNEKTELGELPIDRSSPNATSRSTGTSRHNCEPVSAGAVTTLSKGVAGHGSRPAAIRGGQIRVVSRAGPRVGRLPRRTDPRCAPGCRGRSRRPRPGASLPAGRARARTASSRADRCGCGGCAG